MKTKETRIGDCILCNPAVKLTKGKIYPVIDIDKITVGKKFVTNRDVVVYNGQGGAKFENGDTLMARITPCLENGKMAKAKIDGLGLGSTELFVFRGKEGVTDNDYVYYLLKQQYIRNLAANSMTGASGRQRADLKYIKKIKLDIPSLEIQRRIASILSAYDNLIENNNRRIRLLEQMAENLYKEWFVRFRFPGHEKAEFENGLPKGWKRNKIKEYYNTCSGGTPSREKNEYYNEGTIFWVKTGEIQDSLIQKTEELISTEGLKHSSAKILPKWTLLMAMYGVNIGKLGIITNEMSCNQAACAFIDKGSIPSVFYLFFYLKSIRSYLLSISFGAAQQNLSQVLIQNLRIVMPQEDVLKSFDNVIRPLYNQICALQQQSELLSRQRDLLLPRLMSGKIEVKV